MLDDRSEERSSSLVDEAAFARSERPGSNGETAAAGPQARRHDPAQHGEPGEDEPSARKAGAPSPTETDSASLSAGTKPAKPARKRSKKKVVLPLLLLAAIGAGGWYAYDYITVGRFFESTDDAYVGADMNIVSPKIGGYVERVAVEENQRVRAGQTLLTIDPGDYELAVQAAEAKIETQQATVERAGAERAAAEASVQEAAAQVEAAKAELGEAENALSRARNLAQRGAGAKAVQDTATSGRDAAKAKLSGATAALAAANADLSVVDARKVEAERILQELAIARDKAKRDLSFTTLKAPYDGIVGNLAVQPGDLVSAGRRLAAIVPLEGLFVEGNFKETQLADIVPGQTAHIEIDALPGTDITGHVVSLSPASGSVFSLLPTDNATGNFTKITQRVPVRIAVDDSEALAGKLRPGLSAVVSVDLRTTPEHAPSVTGAPPAAAATTLSH